MKLLNGAELADYIKMRQVHEVRSLKQARGITTKLTVSPDLLKRLAGLKEYAADLDFEIEVSKTASIDLSAAIVLAVDWLLAGYNVNLPGKNIVIVSNDLDAVTELETNYKAQTPSLAVTSQQSTKYAEILSEAEVVICAADRAESITEFNSDPKLVVAGLAQDDPLLVCALVEQAIRAAN